MSDVFIDICTVGKGTTVHGKYCDGNSTYCGETNIVPDGFTMHKETITCKKCRAIFDKAEGET